MSLGFVGRLGVLARQNGRMFSSCFCANLQPLAQALDVLIVRLVQLLVHFQQRPQDFDAMLSLHHTLSVLRLGRQRSGIWAVFIGFTDF